MRLIAVASIALMLTLNASSLTAQQSTAPAATQTVVGGSVATKGATISGTVLAPSGMALGNTRVQARNLITGRVGGSARTAAGGEFVISGLEPGSYVIEIVDDEGAVIGTSSYVSAPAGAAITAATVIASTGVLSAVTTSAAGVVATLGATAARSMTFAAAAAGVAGVVAPPEVPVASPSR